jgi:hypothetical protein
MTLPPQPTEAAKDEGGTASVPEACRSWLSGIADTLIPAAASMPSASEMGVATGQLDQVLRARPDLTRHLLRAWATTADSPAEEALQTLQSQDSAGYDALRLIVAGGYYIHPEIKRRLGYTGQQPEVVRVDQIPAYVEEGLLERVLERGPIYRDA